MRYYLKPLIIILPVILIVSYYLVTLSNRSEFSEKKDVGEKKEEVFRRLDLAEMSSWKGQKLVVSASSAPIIIMHFWAAWCEPCIHEFPELIRLAKEMKGKVKIFALSEDKDKAEIEAFIKSFKDAEGTENFHIVWDENHTVMNQWAVTKLPESFIYGPNRKLAKHINGAVSWTTPESLEYFKILENSEEFAK